MARVTIEDCIDKVTDRFELILLSSHRARMITNGAPLLVERDRDKNSVVSLREIADGAVLPHDLREEVIQSLQRYAEVDEPESEQEIDSLRRNANGRREPDAPGMDSMTEDEILRFVSKMSRTRRPDSGL